ncbi:hypothetical protein [Rheinheimera texasensis]|uniref:hypothetical protein n=1 Tax=Rheinheimera texasensis TaxID=306205 RepID=UPI0004E13AD1|nr:hypothetical protein [Rheinheimera texasensis]
MGFFDFLFKSVQTRISTDERSEIEGEKFFRQAIQFSQYGNQEEAINHFSYSISSSPHHSSVFLNRGACLMIQERYLEAYEDFMHVIHMEKNRLSIDGESSSNKAIENIKRIAIFIEFEKKHGKIVQSQIADDGVDHFCMRWSEVLFNDFLSSDKKITRQFVFEELKELEEMGGFHQEFALNCGINYSDFSNVSDEYDTFKAFSMFKSVLCCFSRDPLFMFQIRRNIILNLSKMIYG